MINKRQKKDKQTSKIRKKRGEGEKKKERKKKGDKQTALWPLTRTCSMFKRGQSLCDARSRLLQWRADCTAVRNMATESRPTNWNWTARSKWQKMTQLYETMHQVCSNSRNTCIITCHYYKLCKQAQIQSGMKLGSWPDDLICLCTEIQQEQLVRSYPVEVGWKILGGGGGPRLGRRGVFFFSSSSLAFLSQCLGT